MRLVLAIWLCLLMGLAPHQAAAAIDPALDQESCQECQCCISPNTSPLPMRNVPAAQNETKTEVAEPALEEAASAPDKSIPAPETQLLAPISAFVAVPLFLRHRALLI